MSAPEKTFKVNCPNCDKPFHLRLALANPDAEGSGDIRVDCMHCAESVMITIPRRYMAKEFTLKQE